MGLLQLHGFGSLQHSTLICRHCLIAKSYETNFKFELLIFSQHYKKHNPIFLNFFDVIFLLL
jgi:hypothetical protein